MWKIKLKDKSGKTNLSTVHRHYDKRQGGKQVAPAVYDLYIQDNSRHTGNKLTVYMIFKHGFETEAYALCPKNKGQISNTS